jgi:peptidoglycan/LPS O-acetylase OafA/YrhL
LDPIALGALAASSLEGTQLVLRTSRRILLIAGRTAVLMILGAFGSSDGPRALITYPLVSFAALLMLLAAIGFPVLSRQHFLVRAGIHLGRISYGLYVFHGPVIELMKSTSLPPIVWRVAAFTATVGIAWLSYRYFESPFLRLKTRYSLLDRGRV